MQPSETRVGSASGGLNPATSAQPAASLNNTTANSGQASFDQPIGVLPAMAQDHDLIEQEWVATAKKFMRQYQNDPYLQAKAMAVLRQDYLKKRYGA